ncbi:deoxyribodipyrimidine photo-lyase [Nocardiopsis composta]|uniref:cryptochrome/photolyase family protein n=1 Tax=Nocardiopsis composta TaxID=157465 RepID=UPI0031DEF2F3
MTGAPVIVLFNRDLRVHDHPALHAAAADGPVVPLFVTDPRILRRAARNRIRHLCEALADLRTALRARGGELFVREGETVPEALRTAAATGARAVFATADVSDAARRRERALAEEGRRAGVEFRAFPGATVVPPGAITPAGGGHYRVFTPYLRAWERTGRRPVLPAPDRVAVPEGLPSGELPGPDGVRRGRGALSPEVPRGGEEPARARLRAWSEGPLSDYGDRRDLLAADATSRLSADLRFGCLSPLEVAEEARGRPGADAFVRQLAWRDFHHQVAADFPGIARRDYRPRGTAWRDDPGGLEAWREGRTGIPIVDAGMRQLLREGFMHNRARMLTAAFLTRGLRVHWRRGAEHFHDLLLDGDIADNHGNWQWVAGTGNDTRPNRRTNLLRQARRFDPDGTYVRRYLPELAGLPGGRAHTPWAEQDPPADYPPPLLDPSEGLGGD